MSMLRLVVGEDARVSQWVVDRAGHGVYHEHSMDCAIGLEEEGRLIAGVMYDHFFGRSVAMCVAIDRKGIGHRGFLRFAFRYPFNDLKVHKILGFVAQHNEGAHAFIRHVGFRHTHTINDVMTDPSDRGRTDLWVFEMQRADCRFL